jgi:hypothetical protein
MAVWWYVLPEDQECVAGVGAAEFYMECPHYVPIDVTWCKGDPEGSYVELENGVGNVAWVTETVEGLMSSALTITAPLNADAGDYFVRVLEGGVYENSAAATLTVTGDDPPPDPDVPDEREWWTFACTPYGSLRDASLTVEHDFTRILVFDLALGKVYPGWGFPIVCTLANSSPCAGPAQTPTGIFGGTADGHIAKVMGPDCAGLGTPCRKIAWPLAAGCTTEVLNVALTEDEDFLPTYWVEAGPPEVRAGFLAGLPVVILYANGTEAEGLISANTNDTVTLGAALAIAPAAGDVILISPMTSGLWFREQRTQFPSCPMALFVDGYNNQGREQPMTLNIFASEGAENAVDHTAPAVSREFAFEDTEIGDGRIPLPGLASKSLMYGLWFRPVGGGYFQIDGLRVLESVR